MIQSLLNSMARMVVPCVVILMGTILTACGGGGGGGGPAAGVHTLGGTVTGLASGRQFILLSGAGTQVTLKSNGNFTFPDRLPSGAKYSLSVAEQPTGQSCRIINDNNSAETNGLRADALNITIVCSENGVSVGGQVFGLPPGGSVTLGNGPQSVVTSTANGAFALPVKLPMGASYAVTVLTQPLGSTCSVVNGSGTTPATAVTSVEVRCAPSTYSIGGQLAGMAIGSRVTLRLNDGNPMTVSANGAFSFPTTVPFGASYQVTVVTPPDGQSCSVAQGTGANISSEVSTVQIVCSARQYAVGGSVVGLVPSSSSETLTLLNAGADPLPVTVNGPFVFARPVAHGGSFSVTIGAQPRGQTCFVLDGSGTSITAPVGTVLIQCLGYVWRTTLLAGSGAPGGVDDFGFLASFDRPAAVASDPWGRLVVADLGSSRIRRVALPLGEVKTLAGGSATGYVDAAAPLKAAFHAPAGVAVDASGDIFVADSVNHVIRRISALNGAVTTWAGAGVAGSIDGSGTAARFNTPRGLAFDRNGHLLVADSGNHVIRRIAPNGEVTRVAGSFGQRGRDDGTTDSARFHGPSAVAVDAGGTIYVADTLNSLIRFISPNNTVGTLAGGKQSGSEDGVGSLASFAQPLGLAVDASGLLLVADSGNHLIRQILVQGGTGTVLTIAGARRPGYQDGVGTDSLFNQPAGIAVTPDGAVIVTEVGGQRIRRLVRFGG